VNGENVKICAQNLAGWAPELRNQLSAILNASAPAEMDAEIRRAAELADQMLNGIDLNENARVEPVAGECGAIVTYEATYRMADMPLLPVNPLDTPTATSGTAVTPTATFVSPVGMTPTSGPGDSVVTAPPAQPTDRIPPGQATKEVRPTREPRPTRETNDNNGGGNDGSGNNGGGNGGNPND